MISNTKRQKKVLISKKKNKKNNYFISSGSKNSTTSIKLQWLEHRWLVYRGYFEIVLEFLGKHHIVADIIIVGIILGDFRFHIDNDMLCVLVRIASMRRF